MDRHFELLDMVLVGILFALSKSHLRQRENLTNLKSMDHHYQSWFGLFDVLIKQQEDIYLARESKLLIIVDHFD